MENTNSSSDRNKKRGLLAKAVERCRSFGSRGTNVMRNEPKSIPSSPRTRFWNRSKSTSFHGSSRRSEKRNLFTKTFQRSMSVGSFLRRPKSSSGVAPSGCFTVCVGPTMERFFVKMACLECPTFHGLLQEAENEFGFAFKGPLLLPCDVETFREVMREMELQGNPDNSPRCNFFTSPYRYDLLSPSNSSFIAPGSI